MRVLALDLGTRRIGVAISDELRLTARALGTISSVGPRKDAHAIRELVGGLEVDLLVVGLPLRGSGDEGASARRARAAGEDLARRLGLPVAFVDEFGTTLEAEGTLREEGVPRARRRGKLDERAAVLILASYLEAARGA